MSNIAAQDKKSSDVKLLSKTETMQMVFDELRSYRPKPLESCDFCRLPLHSRFISLPNMANSAAEAPTEVGWKSIPNLMVPAVDDRRSNMLKPSVSSDVLSFPVNNRSASLPNVAARENSSGDAPETQLSFGTSSAGLPVSTDSPSRAESSFLALMPPATAEDDCRIKTPLSVASPLPPVEAGVTDTVTSSDRFDAGTDMAVTTVTPRRPRRSLWNRTKRFVRSVFCCGAVDCADE
ncbi:uncharacterized protein LOC132947521 [Metopolophium dirhodum]|uniref:uncharacterized protein LOC132947521 n=1 Tax=Metopolophium dirhodum TaxID=44670 RepID=UPI00298FAC8A|nr:uncharacterized protein LOC132947521 [Metopolophium dirhodum]